jgi:hypothetical protein|tara:strand:- start:289 stop:525 length:237 start_codon:yes stop_codon:yes gene_type:complete
MIELKIKTPSQFALEIEMVVKEKNIDYLDAVMYYVEKNNIEVETAASLIKSSQILKGKIAAEAEELRLLKTKSARLPI